MLKLRQSLLLLLIVFFINNCGGEGSDVIKKEIENAIDPPPNLTYILNIKDDVNIVKDYSENTRYFGEIKNTGTGVASHIKVTFTSYDINDNVIGVDYTYINGVLYFGPYNLSLDSALGQNDYGSFECYTDIPYGNIVRYKTEITYSKYKVSTPKISLALNDKITEQKDSSDNKKYLGEVINNGGGTASFVRIQFTMKNFSDLVIGTKSTYLNGTTCTILETVDIDSCLSPSEIGSFKLNTRILASDIDSFYYRIFHSEYDVAKPSIMKSYIDKNINELSHDEKIFMRNKFIDDQLQDLKNIEN